MNLILFIIFSNFLKVEVGARATGMGGAFTGVSNDPTCVYYNPAGLSGIKDIKLFFMHNSYFLDMYQELFSGIFPTNKGVFGLSVNYFSSGKIPYYENFTKMGEYTAYDLAFILSYASKFKDFNLGLNLKTIYRKIEKENSRGIGFDFGILYKFKFLQAGIMIANLGPKTKFIEESESLPLLIRAGISSEPLYDIILLSFDIVKPYNGDLRVNTGVEISIKEKLYIRAGYSTLKSYSMGIGIKLKKINVDYAFVPYVLLDENTHRFSITFIFFQKHKLFQHDRFEGKSQRVLLLQGHNPLIL